jgi:hypothetical protein
MSQADRIVIDGANVAYLELTESEEPKLANIIAVRKALEERGNDPIVIVDASLRHEIDDSQALEEMIDRQAVRQAPAGADADYFILETADRYGAPVVSNDDFDQYKPDYTWLDEQRVPLMIIECEVELYELQSPHLGKQGPSGAGR